MRMEDVGIRTGLSYSRCQVTTLNFFSVQLEGGSQVETAGALWSGLYSKASGSLLFCLLSLSSVDAEHRAVSGLGLLCGK